MEMTNVTRTLAEVSFPAVLVVGDDRQLVSSLERALRRAGFSVKIEAPGEETARAVEEDDCDAIILGEDAGTGGPGVVSRVRRRFPQARIVLATAVGHVLVGQAALDPVSRSSTERMRELVRAVRGAATGGEHE